MLKGMSRRFSILFYVLLVWTIVSAVLLLSYVLFVEWVWQAWYYVLWPVLGGGLVWRYWLPLKRVIDVWSLAPILKYVLIVYGMVSAEEVLASLLNHLSEGFYFPLYIKRIGQFWALNLLAFSGVAWGSYLVFSRVYFSRIEMFCVLGMFGQISEHLIYRLLFVPGEKLAAFVLLPLNFWVYGAIFLPAFFVIEGLPRKVMRAYWRYPLVFMVIVACGMPFIGFLDWSRALVPSLYPPRNFVP